MTQQPQQPVSRDEFETVKELLASAARYAESANERLEHASMTIGDNALAITRNAEAITRLEQLVEANSQSILRLEALIQQVSQDLANSMNQAIAEAAADRALIREAIEAMFHYQANGGGQD